MTINLAAIEVQDLVFDYPNRRALFGVNLSIHKGAVTALVGPNGAGKTTLLTCLAALDRPWSGSVHICGINTIDDPRGVHARVGYLPDHYGLYNELTVEKCILFAALSRGVPPSQAKAAAAEAAERAGIGHRLSEYPGELSRGLKQRVAIAQAIVHKPEVILLDEPASNLDPEARRALSGLIRGLADDGAAVVVSSHILSELEDYSDQMVVVRHGRIRAGGPVRRETTDPRERRRITVADGFDTLEAVLKAVPELEIEPGSPGAAEVTVRMDAAKVSPQKLLEILVTSGVPVIGYDILKTTLEDAYLAEIAAEDAETGEAR